MKNPTSKQTSSTVASYLYNLRFSQLDIKSNIRTLGNISVASLILASSGFLAYKVYSNFFSFSRGSNESSSIDGRKIRKDLNRKVAIVINKVFLLYNYYYNFVSLKYTHLTYHLILIFSCLIVFIISFECSFHQDLAKC